MIKKNDGITNRVQNQSYSRQNEIVGLDLNYDKKSRTSQIRNNNLDRFDQVSQFQNSSTQNTLNRDMKDSRTTMNDQTSNHKQKESELNEYQ